MRLKDTDGQHVRAGSLGHLVGDGDAGRADDRVDAVLLADPAARVPRVRHHQIRAPDQGAVITDEAQLVPSLERQVPESPGPLVPPARRLPGALETPGSVVAEVRGGRAQEAEHVRRIGEAARIHERDVVGASVDAPRDLGVHGAQVLEVALAP